MGYLQGYDDDQGECLEAIRKERFRQEDLKRKGRFRYTCADKEMSDLERLAVLVEEVGEVSHELNERIGKSWGVEQDKLLAKELIQVAAVTVAWLEAIQARNARRLP